MKYSGQSLEYLNDEGKKIIPYVIEPSIGLDRLLFALLIDSYEVEKLENDERIVLHLDYKICPYQVAIFPLMKKLNEKAKEVYNYLLENSDLRLTYDESGSIGKRYRRQDALGTFFAITIDFDSLEKDTVTIRHRDTMKQDTIKISEIQNYLKNFAK
ncbi:hypothetical protein oki361_19460 [Helicobacter pylori]